MTYFVLDTELTDQSATIGAYPDLPVEVSWFGGRPIARPLPAPLTFRLLPEGGREMPVFFMSGIPLMRQDLVAALQAAGVDNLDTYEARIEDPRDGRSWTDYRAVNVIGVVACADMKRSNVGAGRGSSLIDVDFDGLVIDESRTGGALLFRLAECVTAIIAHARVKEAVESRNIPGVVFRPPLEWVG